MDIGLSPSRKYCLIGVSLIFSLIIFQNYAASQITAGVLTRHDANAEIVYNWFTYVPNSITKSEPSYILMTCLTGMSTETYEEISEHVRNEAQALVQFSENRKYILLFAALPRPGGDSNIYVGALDKECFFDSTDSFSRRPDLKVNLMIDNLIAILEQAGYNVQHKVFVNGFSAAGMWANRYSLIHPDRVKAYAAGGNMAWGMLTLPESAYNGVLMDWPVGVDDFPSLTGTIFKRYAFKKLPQLIFIGDQDGINDGIPPRTELLTESQVNFIETAFGTTPPAIAESQCNLLKRLGYDVTFKLYPGVGHTMTTEMNEAIFSFFENLKVPDGPIEHRIMSNPGALLLILDE